jgi:predicted ATPase
MAMRIKQISIKNYRLFKNVVLKDLLPLTVLVGKNGTGKSTFFDVFSFLKDALTQNVSTAVAKRGGFKELVSRGSNGPIFIEIKFFKDSSGKDSSKRIATYHLEIGQKNNKIIVEKEILKYTRFGGGQPWKFLDFKEGEGQAITNELDEKIKDDKDIKRDYYKLDAPDILAIKGLGQFEKFKVASDFRNLIENWHVSDFHISDARHSADAGFAEHLSNSGDNIPLVTQYLFENYPDVFDRILSAMKQRVPGVRDVKAVPMEDGRLVLRFQDESFKNPFAARYVSDGTIKMFAYLVLLYDPKPFPMLAVEEPENQLYPELLAELAEEFRLYTGRGGQVFLSTHSPDLLNGIDIKEIFYLDKKDGFTAFHRAKDNKILLNLSRDEKLGSLWQSNTIDSLLKN